MSLVLAALVCSQAIFINRTKHPMNQFDADTLVRATKRCKELYPKSPCLKYFIKTGARDYQVICSKEVSNGKEESR